MLFIDIDRYIDDNSIFLTDTNTVKQIASSILEDNKSSINSNEPIKFKTSKLFHISSTFFELILRDRILYSMDLDTVRDDIFIDTSRSVIKKNMTHAVNKLYKKARQIEKSCVRVSGGDDGGKTS